MKACCAGWPADRIPETAKLELIPDPPRYQAVPPAERSYALFKESEWEVFVELLEAGYFSDGLPEDQVAKMRKELRDEELTPEQWQIYGRRIRPLLRIRFFEPERFEEEYARLRTAPPA